LLGKEFCLVAEDISFSVSSDCRRLGLRSGAVIFRKVRVAEASAELRAEAAQEINAVRARFADMATVRAVPEVAAFREMLRAMGLNLKKMQPSVERLLNLALKRGTLPAINNLVDAYNLVSIRSLCSLGAHDLDRITLPVSLRLLTGQETFTPLGQDRAVPIAAGEFGYVDAADRVLCWLDVLQAEFSKVTPATVNALLIVEGTTVHSAENLERTLTAAMETITRYCGGAAAEVASPL
jgi:DNA/RNA-binding domain of Phe-tRNA-synthetase-like protein